MNFAIRGLAAALGEETLFRAAIQPVAGIAVASVLFMLAHSLIADFRHPNPGKVAYALLALCRASSSVSSTTGSASPPRWLPTSRSTRSR